VRKVDFLTLWNSDLQTLKHALRKANAVRFLVVTAFFILLAFVALAIFAFSKASFNFLIREESEVGVLSLFTLGVAFLLLSGIFLVSNLLYFFTVIFKDQKNRLLATLPISAQTFFVSRFVNATILSSWPIFVLGLPVLLAFGQASKAGIGFYLIFFVSLLPLVLLFSSISAIITLLVARIFGNLTFKVTFLSLLVLIPTASFLFAKIIFPTNLGQIFSNGSLSARLATLEKLAIFWPVLPSTWFVRAVGGWFFNQPVQLIFNLFLIWLVPAVFLVILLYLAEKYYLFGLQKSFEGRLIAGSPDQKVRVTKSQTFGKDPLSALFKKEILTFGRDAGQLGYLGFLFFLTLVYFFALARVPTFENISSTLLSVLVAANFLFIGYILIVIAVRFAFPSVSLEGKSAWVVWSLPVRLTTLLWAKFFFFVLLVVLAAGILANLSAALLGFDWPTFLTTLLLAIFAGILSTTIALTFGAIWPDFTQKSGEQASTSLPGLLATVISLLIISLFTFWFWQQLKIYLVDGIFWPTLGVVLVVFGTVTVFLTVTLWLFAQKAIKNVSL